MDAIRVGSDLIDHVEGLGGGRGNYSVGENEFSSDAGYTTANRLWTRDILVPGSCGLAGREPEP